MRLLVFAALLLAAAPLAAAQPPVRVEHAIIPWVPGWVPHAAFFQVTNTGERPVQLAGARSDDFARIEFHAAGDGDLFLLEGLTLPLEIAPGETVEFHRRGPRLMLFVQSQWLEPGDRAEIALEFRGFDPLPVTFTVRKRPLH